MFFFVGVNLFRDLLDNLDRFIVILLLLMFLVNELSFFCDRFVLFIFGFLCFVF